MEGTTEEGGASRLVRPVAIGYAVGLWLVLAVLAVVNGVGRELVLVPRLGERTAHHLSTGLLAGAILAVCHLAFGRGARQFNRPELLGIGVLWVALTVPFEFVVGYVDGIPVEETVTQYDVTAGESWIAVPVTLFVAPWLFGRKAGGTTEDRSNGSDGPVE